MSQKQIRVSEDVYEMLEFLKQTSSTSFNDLIQTMIEVFCPYLLIELKKLKLLEQQDPQEAFAERILLRKEVYLDAISELYSQWHERDLTQDYEEYVRENGTEQEKAYLERQEKERHLERQKILREMGMVKEK
jgi:hypothetical protein